MLADLGSQPGLCHDLGSPQPYLSYTKTISATLEVPLKPSGDPAHRPLIYSASTSRCPFQSPSPRDPISPTPHLSRHHATGQWALTELGLWRPQHLPGFLPDGFAVFLELVKPFLSPRARLHFQQQAALQEELQVVVILQACAERYSSVNGPMNVCVHCIFHQARTEMELAPGWKAEGN